MAIELESIPVKLKDGRLLHIRGYVIGCYTIGGVIRQDGRVTTDRWAIRCAKTGMNVATFTDRKVAVNFLRWLWNTYGDITETLQRCYDYQETPGDSKILDDINARSKHEVRVYMV